MDNTSLEKITRRIRRDILTMTTRAGSGHPTSSLSAVELMTVLFFSYLRYDLFKPANPQNDRVIFSKGHASPLYYALFAATGVLREKDLETYRTFNSVLEGHPTPRFPYAEAATGSLGQGLSIGLGEALAGAPHVYVLMGDGELAEGSVWEAAAAASHYHVSNLVLIVDINRLGQSDPTMIGHDYAVYKTRFEAFGWYVITVDDGHDLALVDQAYSQISRDKPTVILAKTVKGKGVSFLEDKSGWHGKPLSGDELTLALKELGDVNVKLMGTVIKPEKANHESGMMNNKEDKKTHDSLFTIHYSSEKPVSTRRAFGNALARIGSDPRIVVIDGDVKNSSYTEFFAAKYPERFYEMYIAEQNMAGVATGMAARGLLPVVSSFSCFLTRAADQFRMASVSGVTMIVNGTHAGVSIGADGPSQMGLEDIALFRAIRGSTVLYPSDGVSTEKLVGEALRQKGITYIRTSRPDTPIVYDAKEKFPVGGSKVHEASSRQGVIATVIAAGITLHEALKAQEELKKDGIGIRVIDCYSVKPLDTNTIRKAVKETKAIIVVEDHNPEGGLGEAVLSALASDSGNQHIKIYHLAVRKTPRSGKPAELLAYEEIDAAAIVKKVKELI